MSVISIFFRRTPSWSMTFLKRSWVIGRESLTFTSATAMLLASRMPIQMGRMFRFSRSRRMPIGDWVPGSIVIPTTCISLITMVSFHPRERMGSGGSNADPPERSRPGVFCVEVHCLVAGGAPEPLRLVPRASTLDQNLELFPETGIQAFAGVSLLQGLETAQAPAGLVGRNGIRQGSGAGTGTRGKPEGKGGIVADFFHHGEGLLEVFFRFPGKPDDEVGGEGDPGFRPPQGFDLGKVPVPRVSPPHERKDPVGTRLQGEMHVGAELFDLPEKADRLRIEIPRMGRDEADPRDSGHPGDLPQQPGERDLPFLPAVGIDVLSQKDHFRHPAVRKPPDLVEDLPGGPADLIPAHMRYDAIRAVIVTTLHDRHHR